MLRNADQQTKWDSRTNPTEYQNIGYISAENS